MPISGMAIANSLAHQLPERDYYRIGSGSLADKKEQLHLEQQQYRHSHELMFCSTAKPLHSLSMASLLAVDDVFKFKALLAELTKRKKEEVTVF